MNAKKQPDEQTLDTLKERLTALINEFSVDLVLDQTKKLAAPNSPLRPGSTGVNEYVIRAAFYVDARYRNWSMRKKADLIGKITDTDLHAETLKRIRKREQFRLWKDRVYEAEQTTAPVFSETEQQRNKEDEALKAAIADLPPDLRILIERKIDNRRPLMDAYEEAVAELSPRDVVKYGLGLDEEIYNALAQVRSRERFIGDFMQLFLRVIQRLPQTKPHVDVIHVEVLSEVDKEMKMLAEHNPQPK